MSLTERLGLKSNPVFLMDGSAYIFRSFYANQNMTRGDGTPTNVLYMVLRMLFKILREENPAYFAFILDGRGKNFRHRLYHEYKNNRLATPEPLSLQIPPLCDAMEKLGLFYTISEDCEADDCIASLAARWKNDHPVVIIGADKDLKQCLAPNVYLWDPSGKDERLTSAHSFVEEQGFSPERWPDYQAIVGDSSDNIPGVPGIGPKGANTLMREFAGLDEIKTRMPAVPPALRGKLEGNLERAFMARELTRLRLDVCPQISLGQIALKPPRQREILALLETYELRSLARELSSMLRISADRQVTQGQNIRSVHKKSNYCTANIAENIQSEHLLEAASIATREEIFTPAPPSGTLWTQGSLLSVSPHGPAANLGSIPALDDLTRLAQAPVLAVVFAQDAGGSKNDLRLILGDGKTEFICPVAPDQTFLRKLGVFLSERKVVAAGLKAVFEKYPLLRPDATRKQHGLENNFDLSLAAWLLSPEEYDYSLQRLHSRWGADAQDIIAGDAGTLGKGKVSAAMLGMHCLMRQSLKTNNLDGLMDNMEMPLISALLDMQDAGLGINPQAFNSFLVETAGELDDLSRAIYRTVGREFNIRSSKQLSDILFTELNLPKARKTTGGQTSTAQEALEKLLGKHPLIELLLDFRKLEKLRSTYLEPLPKLADAQNRLHTSFNQSSTATGRLSSSNPNLQNIPVRGPLGMRMRACFTPAKGNLLVSADYSQIELRVLAHLSQDPTLLDSFRKGEDIHQRTASLLFDTTPDKITPDQRRNAKTINFGLIYGMGPQKLAQDLKISLNAAKTFITHYFEKLGTLKEYFAAVELSAKTNGFVVTLTGRRRSCPEISSANQQLFARARRQAINACIQGSAADIIKLAMLAAAADHRLKELDAKLILQIHDELLLECPQENAKKAGERLAEIMAGVAPGGQKLSIPLSADWGAGRNWAEAH